MPEDTKPADGAQKDTAKSRQAKASELVAAEAQPAASQQTFRVILQPIETNDQGQSIEPVTGFSYVAGERYEHWSKEEHGLEVEFKDLSIARGFMAAAEATGALKVAESSKVRLKQAGEVKAEVKEN